MSQETTATDPDIRTTEVDSIRTVLAPAPGPVTAGLFFRVGVADETLATAGITHLVEHLALHRHGVSDLHYNGATAATYTLFHVTGTPDEVVTYLNGVCAALRDLPVERLETERDILRRKPRPRSRAQPPTAAVAVRSTGLRPQQLRRVRRLASDHGRGARLGPDPVHPGQRRPVDHQ